MSKYSQQFSKSATRHLNAAVSLHHEGQGGSPDVAGYLFGVAAECAVKQIMRESGMTPLPPNQRRDDPFYAHFPELKTLLRNTVQGRRAGELRAWCEDGVFMRDWDTDMRYAPSKDITKRDVERWREDATRAIAAMNL
jgi:hypothetical protein